LSVDRPVCRSEPEHFVLAVGQLGRGKLGFALGFGQVREAFPLPLPAVVMGECELRIDGAIDAISSRVNLHRDVAALDFEGPLQAREKLSFSWPKLSPKVKAFG